MSCKEETGFRSLVYATASAAGIGACSAVAYTPSLCHRLLTRNQGCLFRRLTGFRCPFCGMTHATVSLLHGGFITAARQDAIVFLIALAAVVSIINGFKGGRSIFERWQRRLPWLTSRTSLVIAVAYSVLRDV